MITKRVETGSTVFGLIVLGLGVLFLLDTTGAVDDIFSFFTLLAMALIVWGLSSTIHKRGRGIFGPIMFLLGLGFLLHNLDVLGAGWIGRWWPIALIVSGVVLLAGARRGRS